MRVEWRLIAAMKVNSTARVFSRAKATLLLAGALILCHALRGQQAPPESAWRISLEPKFMRAPVVAEIAGARETQLVAGTRDEHGSAYLLKAQFDELKMDWGNFAAKARANADAELARIEPRFVRDSRNVISYAVLNSEEPIVASAVQATKLLERFADTLGEKLLLAVPNRYTAYIFPHLASDYQQYAPMVLRAYRATAEPVSREVFEVSADGWKAIGVFEE